MPNRSKSYSIILGNVAAVIVFTAIVVILQLHPERIIQYQKPTEVLSRRADDLVLINPERRTSSGNETCIIVGCHTQNTPGVESYWKYYSRSAFAFSLYSIESVNYGKRHVPDTWCDVPATRDELRLSPKSRIIYVDIDTKIDVKVWCELPNHESAPLILNSLARATVTAAEDFIVAGTQVQANVFRVAPGNAGLWALRRWEDNFQAKTLQDQGAIHRFENRLCGVPGWVACFHNPEQQNCHCFGSGNWTKKDNCIDQLFKGTLRKCKL